MVLTKCEMENFKLSKNQIKKYKEWQKTLKEVQHASAMGGDFTFKFTPTSLGMLVEVERYDGEKLNLTEYEHFD